MEKQDLRIVYMGTPDFAVEPLRCLVEGGYNVVGVVTMPDKPIGRHQTELSQSPVKQYAVSQGLAVLQPVRLKDEAFVEELRALKADLQIVVAFRMLPEVVWQMPRLGTFNLHASLLPRYRGAAPINWAIINGDQETGITTFFLQHEIDTGDIIQQERIPITPADNAESIHDQLMVLGGRLVVETVENILADRVRPIAQEQMSLPVADYQRQAPKIFKDTCRIDWEQPAEAVFNFIRGLSPYPGAWSEFDFNGKRQVLKIFRSHATEGAQQHPVGTLFAEDGRLLVQQADGLQQLDEVQAPGKKRMAAADFLRGVRLCLLSVVCCLLSLICPSVQAAETDLCPELRSELVQLIGAQRMETLRPVVLLHNGADRAKGRQVAPRIFRNITILNDAEAGFAVVSQQGDESLVLAYGDNAIDPENVSPEFLFLMEQYDQQVADGTLNKTSHKARQRRVNYVNVSSLLTTHWAQSSPYNNKCPLYEGGGSRCLTGCVATSMAQVLNYHKLPRQMRGYKTYGYTTQGGKRMNYGLNFAATSFDWNNMPNSLNSFSSSAQKEAVGTLMYACGVATSMHYHTSSSAAFTYFGADGITNLMDGVKAYMSPFDEDLIIRELQAGHPVIYGGEKPSGEGHSFVIDGVTSDGRYCCNLGWGSQGDGKYLPTNMNGYTIKHDMMVVYPDASIPSCSPIEELRGRKVSVVRPATQLEAGRWYVLWNTSNAASPYARGVGQAFFTRGMMPAGEAAEYAADQLVRFIPAEGSGYYVQFGTGEYLGKSEAYAASATLGTSTPQAVYDCNSLKPGYFYFRNSNCNLDAASASMLVQGWSMVAPSDTVNTSIWQLFPAKLTGEPTPAPQPLPFDGEARYTLRNTGYSQGYLVALTADDAQPTLRGVTQDHAQGLYQGAQYHDEADLTADGSHWRITTEGTQQYLQNVLTGKYLANQGDQTNYVFTAQKTPIYIKQNADGTYLFNSGTQEQSYLCAATHLPTPAAFWTATDAGSLWTVEVVAEPETIVYAPVKTESVLDNNKVYALQNTGYSQGYLVAMSASDTHPTLRGVTQDHSNGLFQGAAYHTALDKENLGNYWQILRQNDMWYLYNVGTERFLTSAGVKESYVFTEDKVALHVTVANDGTFRFNAQNDSESYLCAATHLENPAAFWTSTDAGSQWTVYEVSGLEYTPTNPLVTGICTLEPFNPLEPSTPSYDLQGRPLVSPYRGVMISSGRRKIMR